jgi:hypothetical protein
MLPLLVSAAADLAGKTIQADATSDAAQFANPANAGGVQSLGAITVGAKQIGGKGNSAGATSANPTTTTASGGSSIPQSVAMSPAPAPNQMLLYIVAGGLLLVVASIILTRK